MDEEVRSQHNSQSNSINTQSIKQTKKIESLNIEDVKFQPPTKNPSEVFSAKQNPQQKVENNNDMIDDNKSQTSQKSASSAERKRKGSFIQRMQELQQSEQEKMNEKIKADLKAVFLENVDYKATKQQLQLIFQDCAKIQRITILKNPYTNHPKGCAYISFQTEEGVERALHLSGVTLRNRIIKVHRKRTNVPGKNKSMKEQLGINLLGMMQNYGRGGHRGRGRGRGR